MTANGTDTARFFVGVDVSKQWLDVAVEGRSEVVRIANTPAAWSAWLSELDAQDACQVIVEATGGLEANVAVGCEQRGVTYSIVNPLKARRFAQARGRLAKTDAIDATVLAAFGRAVPQRPHSRQSPERRRLRALVERRADLVQMRTGEKNRLKTSTAPIRKRVREHIAWLDRAVSDLERDIRAALASVDELDEPAKRLQTVKGVGPVTAATVVALLPELGKLDRRSIAALVGLAPYANDSGARRGHRRIYGGRAAVRSALYLAAMVGTRHNPTLKRMYDRLLENKKPKKVALTAVARKLITILNAMIRDETDWATPESVT